MHTKIIFSTGFLKIKLPCADNFAHPVRKRETERQRHRERDRETEKTSSPRHGVNSGSCIRPFLSLSISLSPSIDISFSHPNSKWFYDKLCVFVPSLPFAWSVFICLFDCQLSSNCPLSEDLSICLYLFLSALLSVIICFRLSVYLSLYL